MEANGQIQGKKPKSIVVCDVCRTPIPAGVKPCRCGVCDAPMCAMCGGPDCRLCHNPLCPKHTVIMADKIICSHCADNASVLKQELCQTEKAIAAEEERHLCMIEQLHERASAITHLLTAVEYKEDCI